MLVSKKARPAALALLVSLQWITAPVAGAAEKVITADFTTTMDASGWWWSLQPSAAPILPNPQSDETLPVSILHGERDRVAALRFNLFLRGLDKGSKILDATLRISEGSGSWEQPPVRPDLARLSACRIIVGWIEGEAEPMTRLPQFSSACVAGVRAAGQWFFDLDAIASDWDDPSANRGIVLVGTEGGGPEATWQVNLRRAAALSVTIERPPQPPPPPPVDGGYPAPNDRTGIDGEVIRIGLHASITGAAPVRADSIVSGARRYWDLSDAGGPVMVAGRRVQVEVGNDEANPATARAVCTSMASRVFLIVGFSGPDQSRACADYAASVGVPYVTLGTVEDSLRSLRNVFAISATFARQGPAIAAWIRQFTLDPERVAMIATDTANYDDAVSSFTAAFPGVTVMRPSKAAQGSQYADDVCYGPLARYDAVYVLTNPTFFLELEGSAVCAPAFVGAGLTSGLDTIADLACGGSTDALEAHFFSPAPAYADAGSFDPAFVDSLDGDSGDDLLWLTWAMSRSLHAMLDAAGDDPDRRGFVDAAEELEVHTGAFPDLAFSREDHFGARQAHMLEGVCGAGGRGYFVTEQAFVPLG